MQAQTLLRKLESTSFRTKGENGVIYCSLVKLTNDGSDYVSKNWVDPQRPDALFVATGLRHAHSLEKGEKYLCVECPHTKEFDRISNQTETEKTKSVCELLCSGYQEIRQGLITLEMKKMGENSYTKL